MEERRKYQREQVEETAYICGSGSSIRCLLRDISRQGAALDVPDPAFIPACFKLILKAIALFATVGSRGLEEIGSALHSRTTRAKKARLKI